MGAIMTLYSAVITLILVMDPIGNIPMFLVLLKNAEPKRRPKIILRESFIAFIIMTIFVFVGKYIISGLGLSKEALEAAGGIVLFLIALKMIFPEPSNTEKLPLDEPFVVPMAIPLIAGPSALATVLLFTSRDTAHVFIVFFAVLIASVISTIILLFSEPLRKLLRQRGLTAVERLMGMILTIVAVQMFLDGIASYLRLMH